MEIKKINSPEVPKQEILKDIERCKMGLEFLNISDEGLECTITSMIDPSLTKEKKEELDKVFKNTALALKNILSKSMPDLQFSKDNFINFYGEGHTVSLIRPALKFHINQKNSGEDRKEIIQKITTWAKEQGLKI